jgi:hypothetical protein
MDLISLFIAVKSLKAHVHYFVILAVGVSGFDKFSSLLVHVFCVDCKNAFLGMNEPDSYFWLS